MIAAPLLLAVLLAPTAPQGSQKCVQDARTCLLSFFEMYLIALDSRKPESLPVAADVKFTEDSKQLKFGEGLWTTVSRVCGYQLVATDVAQGALHLPGAVDSALAPRRLLPSSSITVIDGVFS